MIEDSNSNHPYIALIKFNNLRGQFNGKTDYISVEIHNEEQNLIYSTATICPPNPVWDESFNILVKLSEKKSLLNFKVIFHKTFFRNVIATGELEIGDLISEQSSKKIDNKEITIYNDDSRDKIVGFFLFDYKWMNKIEVEKYFWKNIAKNILSDGDMISRANVIQLFNVFDCNVSEETLDEFFKITDEENGKITIEQFSSVLINNININDYIVKEILKKYNGLNENLFWESVAFCNIKKDGMFVFNHLYLSKKCNSEKEDPDQIFVIDRTKFAVTMHPLDL